MTLPIEPVSSTKVLLKFVDPPPKSPRLGVVNVAPYVLDGRTKLKATPY